MERVEREIEIIYDHYADTVYRFCMYYLNDEEKAKDVIVEVFQKLYVFYHSVEPKWMLRYLLYETKTIINRNQEKTKQ